MELVVYSRDLEPLGLIEKITSFTWARHYWNAGRFTLVVPFTKEHRDLLKKGNIIMRRGDNEAAEIRYSQKKKKKNRKQIIEVQGHFITKWIGKRIIEQPIIATAPPHEIMHRIVTENVTSPTNGLRKIPGIYAAGITEIERDAVDYQSEPKINALLALEQLGKTSKLGFKLTTDIRAENHTFSIYDGKDLTDSQHENPPCVFSIEFDNIIEQELIASTERLRTMAYVGGEETQDRPRQIVEVGAETSGHDRAEVFINASDVRQKFRDGDGNQITLTDAQQDALLHQRGIQELENFSEVLAFSSIINTDSNLRYREDYDLGDKVTCVNREWGIKVNTRITEIIETHSNNNAPKLEVVFGEGLPTLIDTIRGINIQEG